MKNLKENRDWGEGSGENEAISKLAKRIGGRNNTTRVEYSEDVLHLARSRQASSLRPNTMVFKARHKNSGMW